jgi:hypothetical protein
VYHGLPARVGREPLYVSTPPGTCLFPALSIKLNAELWAMLSYEVISFD